MPIRHEIESLIAAHQASDEPLDGALWIWQEAKDAWLVELLPNIPEEAEPYPPFVFGPSFEFPHTLNLVVGPQAALERAIATHGELAMAVASGEVLVRSVAIDSLVALAKQGVAKQRVAGASA